MKTKITVLLAIFTFTLSFGQLTIEAKSIRDSTPEIYDCIVNEAIKQWGNDHEMIVFRINQQADAFISFGKAVNSDLYDREIMEFSINKWSDGDECTIDWNMVVYQYKNQLLAKNEY